LLHICCSALAQLLPLHPTHDHDLTAGEIRVDVGDGDACR
jgi:hypothetical protein